MLRLRLALLVPYCLSDPSVVDAMNWERPYHDPSNFCGSQDFKNINSALVGFKSKTQDADLYGIPNTHIAIETGHDDVKLHDTGIKSLGVLCGR